MRGVDSLSEEVEEVSEDWRWTVLWNSLLLISTTREKSRSWKWLKNVRGESVTHTWGKNKLFYNFISHLLQLGRCLSLVSTDDE